MPPYCISLPVQPEKTRKIGETLKQIVQKKGAVKNETKTGLTVLCSKTTVTSNHTDTRMSIFVNYVSTMGKRCGAESRTIIERGTSSRCSRTSNVVGLRRSGGRERREGEEAKGVSNSENKQQMEF